MKQPTRFLFALVLASALSASALAQMNSHESKRIRQGKITKNEAQHLVMQQYPGATIKKCELRGAKAHPIWVLEVVKAGTRDPIKVEVDERTGKILSPAP